MSTHFERDLATVNENLRLLDAETSSCAERRIALLSDLAALIARERDILDSDDRSERFAELLKQAEITDKAADKAKRYLSDYYKSQLLADKITICKFLAEMLGWRSDFSLAALLGSPGDSFEPIACEDGNPKIAYLKNAYADSAFRKFAEVIGEPSVVYLGDFAAVCEEVYYGRADMCILPLDSSRDAKLISFSRLIDKYELKIVLVCDLPSPDGAVTTRYALLRKTLAFPEKLPEGTDMRLLEVGFVPDETTSLADVLIAAESCGLRLYKVDAIPLSYSDSDFSYDLVLHCPDRAVEPFALFMALAAPQFVTLGVYAKLKA